MTRSIAELTAVLTEPGRITRSGRGDAMHRLIVELYPVCRSITGDGMRTSLLRIKECVGLTLHEVPTGTRVFDWLVPREWNIRNGYIRNSRGETVVDFRNSNLHVMSYSVPVKARMPLSELRHHLHSLPGQPDLIPAGVGARVGASATAQCQPSCMKVSRLIRGCRTASR